MPSPVDKYFKQVKEDNPSYSDAQAWATAWSIYCRHVNPGSPSCHKPTDEYLKKEASTDLVLGFYHALLVQKVASRFIVARSLPEMVSTERMSFKYAPKETKQHKAERVGDKIREVTGLQKGTAFSIAEAHVRGRNVNSLAVQKDWPIERGVITGPKGEMPVSELFSLL